MTEVDGYSVKGPGGTHAKHTTKAKAEAQIRLLHGVEHGMVPTGKKAKHHSPPTNEKFDNPDKY